MENRVANVPQKGVGNRMADVSAGCVATEHLRVTRPAWPCAVCAPRNLKSSVGLPLLLGTATARPGVLSHALHTWPLQH